ncbi:males-absent on the first protein [Drosophila ficusphila]|uniref:males-absent on the first protein n=1 Tax=Drosophila ficusphila TaxID=30025 RepID=UPI0007E78539|nr:males-absent on the first protein [Drosophila ficusphila]
MPNEFYVRYNDLDNKMDAWVGEDRISDTPEGLGGYQGGREGNKLTDEEKKNKKSQPIRNIEKVQFGRYEIDTWYHSPYPYEYGEVPILYVCEFCLKYMRLRESYAYHLHDCKQRQPPGSLVYRNDNIFIFEVDGDKEKLYCQCLSLLSKLFLEYKNLIYDPCPFKFYVMCVKDQDGHHMVGYFAKEKESEMNYNLNCLLVWPPFQRKGYGKLLIALSYEISRKEGLIGGPEKPLSALGRLSYRGFWGYTLLEKLKNLRTKQVTIKKLSQLTYIAEEDIAYTLEAVKLMNYFKGDHIICTNRHIIEARLSLPQMRKPKLVINRKGLSWKV